MKKYFGLALCAMMSLAVLGGCGKSSTTTASSPAETTAAAEASKAEETKAEDAKKEEAETEAAKEEVKADEAKAEDAKADEAKADEAKPEAERTTFIVGFDAEYPPFGFMADDGSYTGFDLELAKAVCDLEGWEFKANPIDWDAKDMELNSGSIDCIWNGFTINGREDDYTWSVPYCDNSQVIVVKKDSGIKSLKDLAGKTVGAQSASAAEDVLTNPEQQKSLGDTFAAINSFKDYNTAFAELDAGAIDALAVDVGVAKFQVASRDDCEILDETLNSEQYGVGFKLGNEELRDIINADLKKLYEDKTVDKLAEKYDIADMICLGK